MAVLDDRGRLFGKVNLIDAVVAGFVIILIPIGYSAYLLFRTPVPSVTSLEPAQITEQQPASVQLTGENFRPYLGAKLGTTYATFLLQDPRHAEIRVPPLAAGTYDLALFDEALELTRRPGALIVVPRSADATGAIEVQLQLVGEFVDLSSHDADRIRPGMWIGLEKDLDKPLGHILATQPPVPDVYRIKVGPEAIVTAVKPGSAMRVPAILRVTCTIANDECQLPNAIAARGAMVALPLLSGRLDTSFFIEEVRPADAAPTF